MSTIGKRIRNMREERKMTLDYVASKIGISKQTLSRYERGVITNIPSDKIEAIAEVFNVPPARIMGWKEDYYHIKNIEKVPPSHKIPLIGDIACGEPITAEENIEGYVGAPNEGHADFCLRCRGDSMSPMVDDGDLVFIRQQEEVETGETAAVLIGNEATLKHVYYNGESLILAANNPAYAPITYSGEQLNEIKILGKAVMLQRVISSKRKF